MKTKYFFLAGFAAMLASCANEEYIGDTSPNATLEQTGGDGSIQFGFDMQNATRGDIYGNAAATLLGNNFYVIGTKGTEATNYPTGTLVFDNYLVHYGVNTAGTTESNTANWEYVGIDPGTTAGCTNHVKLGTYSTQTIKYWDYSTEQYDFWAFSTGTYKAVSSTTPSDASQEIGVTKSVYGSDLAGGTAYTFYLPSETALQNAYITDITEVKQGNYGKEVQLQFKNLGSKIRVALYETVPGYSVKDVKFYASTTTPINHTDGSYVAPTTTATLISSGLPTKGIIAVSFPDIGTSKEPNTQNYNKASATVTPGADPKTTQTFGTLDNLVVKQDAEETGSTAQYLGRTLPKATFAGNVNAQYYQTVFPVSSSSPLTLRVDYTLVATDGSLEEIKVYGANAVVPSTYTKWLPNYAYTYIFKISDNTNGWTDEAATKAGLFPITFDAVVAEATDASGEQRTVTTVATPSITTYQQGHDKTKDEYSKTSPADKDIYVQVMDNSTSPATLKNDLNGKAPDGGSGTDRSLLYAVDKAAATEAEVMDALENRTTLLSAANVTGRNGIVLTKDANITTTGSASKFNIVNGVDNNPIVVNEGEAAMIDISELTPGTYAYVYDYSTADKNTTDIYQPIAVEVGTTDVNGVKYVANTALAAWDDKTAAHYTSSENAAAGYLYFSITTNGGATKTYSFISVDDKIGTALPDGLLKLPVGQLLTGGSGDKAAADTIYFTIYKRNDGKYAVKVIKIVA